MGNSDDDATKRITVPVPESINEAIEALSDEWNTSKSQTTKVLISRAMAMEALVQEGGEIIYQDSNGDETTIYRQAVTNIDEPFAVLDGNIETDKKDKRKRKKR
ncbi:MAG: hypothetical protein AAFQ74_19180 [Cyanobacteria bacterium J06623_4]